MPLKQRLAIDRKKNYLLLPERKGAENLILGFEFYESAKKEKKQNCIQASKYHNCNYFQIRNISQTAAKIFATLDSVFSLIT